MLGIILIFIAAVIAYLTVFILHLHIVHRRRYADLTVVDNFITFELHQSANRKPVIPPPPPYNRTPRRQRQN
jgi:hypothetical protein